MPLQPEEVPVGEVHGAEKVMQTFHEASTLVLTEEQALARARSSPNEALSILITYAYNDRDNPRNWPTWRKWYITCLVSMLNVFTYASRPSAHPTLCLTECLTDRDDEEPGAQVVSLPGHRGFRKNLEYPPRSQLCACHSTFSATQSDPCFSHLCRSTLDASRYTLFLGSFSSYSNFHWLWRPTSVPYWSVDLLQDAPEELP